MNENIKVIVRVCNLSFMHFSDDSLSSSVSQFFIIRMCFPCHYHSELSRRWLHNNIFIYFCRIEFLSLKRKTNNFDDGTGEAGCGAQWNEKSGTYVHIILITKQTMSNFLGFLIILNQNFTQCSMMSQNSPWKIQSWH